MRSEYWWRLWHIWHWPGFIRQGIRPNTFIHFYPSELDGGWYVDPFIKIAWYEGDFKRLVRAIWRDTKSLSIIIWRELIWLQPFRCNSNYGGWRTQFCEWLENKARKKEEIENISGIRT